MGSGSKHDLYSLSLFFRCHCLALLSAIFIIVLIFYPVYLFVVVMQEPYYYVYFTGTIQETMKNNDRVIKHETVALYMGFIADPSPWLFITRLDIGYLVSQFSNFLSFFVT